MPPKKGGKGKAKNGEGSEKTPGEHPNPPTDNGAAPTSANENLQVKYIALDNEKNVTKNMITKIRKNQR